MICPSHKSMCVYTVTIQEKSYSTSYHIIYGVFLISDCFVWMLYIYVIILGDYLLQRFSPVPFGTCGICTCGSDSHRRTRTCVCPGKSFCVYLRVYIVCTRTRSQKRNKMGKIDFIYGRMCTTNTQSTVGVVMHFMKSVDIVFRIRKIFRAYGIYIYMGHTYQAY